MVTDDPAGTAALVDDEPDYDTTHWIGPDPDDWCSCDEPEAHGAE